VFQTLKRWAGSSVVLNEYKEWLKVNRTKKVARYLFSYSMKYGDILSSPRKASEISVMSKGKRKMVMSALSNLSKFLGCYQHWKTIMSEHGLKWETHTSFDTFLSILNSNITASKKWLIEAVEVLPAKYSSVLIFDALTGLRPNEACQSTKMMVELSEEKQLNQYLDQGLMMLQHFRFRDTFLRKNKNAYISFISEDLLNLILEAKPKVSYNALSNALRRRKMKRRIKELRKLHGTLLRDYIPKEAVDLLQGRISQGIFMKFYYKPFLQQIREKSLIALQPLQKELLSILH